MNKQYLLMGLVLLPVATAAATQNLADLAKVEEARRKAVSQPGKVLTNDDLRPDISSPRPGNASAVVPEPSTQVPSVVFPGGKAEPLPPEKDPAFWRGRITAARTALDRSKIFADALQSRINALQTDFVNRDNPVERAQIELERQKALAELDRVKKEIAEQTKAIADIEEEARKAGVPPGWLRQ